MKIFLLSVIIGLLLVLPGCSVVENIAYDFQPTPDLTQTAEYEQTNYCPEEETEAGIDQIYIIISRLRNNVLISETAPTDQMMDRIGDFQTMQHDLYFLDLPGCLEPSRHLLSRSIFAVIQAYTDTVQGDPQSVISNSFDEAGDFMISFSIEYDRIKACYPECYPEDEPIITE